jgi:mRNA interferase RelE/StbE
LRHSEFWRLRIGDYRAIYEVDRSKEQIVVLYIGHRKDVYDDFSRLL